MSVSVQAEDFDPGAELSILTEGRRDLGAVVAFIGLVRDMSDGAEVTAMTLEHYPGMTERSLEAIRQEALARWPLSACRIVHRHGRLEAGDRIVLVITASSHRQAAFEAADFLVDYLKTQAPFWKREEGGQGPRWVEAKASDDQAAARWRNFHGEEWKTR